MAKTVADLLKQKDWHDERKKLRSILLGCGLEEAVKWNKLAYTHDGGNVAIIYGMAASCAIGFFKGSLLEDKEGKLVAPGKYSKAMRRLHFKSLEEIESQEKLIRKTVEEAVALQEAGEKVDFDDREEIDPPQELVDAFDDDPDFKDAFDALTPGRQRGYLLHFTDAKKAETRARRIDKWRGAIEQGKGLHER
ncbi:YdeI/OmpD-associated family protein [Erythrobacter aureus]|uniref:YdeI/OmpD-associated family protein n=1 Tax=Erythrobacter aureus TaxID=2182384 RepID=UPI003A918EB0